MSRPLPSSTLRAAPVTSDRSPRRAPRAGALATDDRVALRPAARRRVHRDFVQRAADVHQRFLALQRSTEATLFRAYGAVQRGTASGATASQPATAALAVRGATPGDVAGDRAGTDRHRRIRSPAPEPRPSTRALPGPTFDRAQLEVLASRPDLLGLRPAFAGQDGYRAPGPHARAAAAARRSRDRHRRRARRRWARARIWTETDVRDDSWYLHEGRMPAGIMIEAGQADLLLISAGSASTSSTAASASTACSAAS